MDGIITVNGQAGRLWLCKKNGGHALGLRVQVQVEGLFVERLMLFRNAVKVECVESEARVMGYPEGTVHDIECTLCKSKRTWWMGKGGLKLALRTYLAE